jgi:SAM-dependent methyltransferase
MDMRKASWIFLFVLPLLLLSLPAVTSTHAQEFEPSVGQPGKDVIWVPTPESLVEAMLDAAKVTPSDFVMDLGSGDGRIVIAAARRGAKAMGIEYNPDMVELSKRKAAEAGVSGKASFVNADIFESDYSKASVITMYLLPNLNIKLRPALLNLKPGTRIVSHAFTMGEWEADQTISKEGRTAYLWIVPAKVDGLWTWEEKSEPARLQLTQNFQKIEGTLTVNGKSGPILNAQLMGDLINFSWGEQNYSGHIKPDGIQGEAESQNGKIKWSAARILRAEK